MSLIKICKHCKFKVKTLHPHCNKINVVVGRFSDGTMISYLTPKEKQEEKKKVEKTLFSVPDEFGCIFWEEIKND